MNKLHLLQQQFPFTEMFNRAYPVSEMGKLNFFTYSDNVASF